MTRAALIRLFVAALLVRAVFLLVEPHARTLGDEGLWRQMAREIASERVGFSPFRTQLLSHPPLYAYFLAGMIQLVVSFQAVKWVQVLLGALLVHMPAGARMARLMRSRRSVPSPPSRGRLDYVPTPARESESEAARVARSRALRHGVHHASRGQT